MSPELPAALRVLRVGSDVPGLDEALALLQGQDFDLVVTHDESMLPALAAAVRARGLAASVAWHAGAGGPAARLVQAIEPPRHDNGHRLQQAIAAGQMRLHYQPQLSAQDGRIV